MATIYEQTMALQARLDNMPKLNIDSRDYAKISLAVINDRWDSSSIRAARSSAAYFIADALTTESYIYPTQKFGEIVLKGIVPKISCIDVDNRLVVALPFFGATVLGPAQEIEPELVEYEIGDYDAVLPLDVRIDRPLYTPVENLGFITLAA